MANLLTHKLHYETHTSRRLDNDRLEYFQACMSPSLDTCIQRLPVADLYPMPRKQQMV